VQFYADALKHTAAVSGESVGDFEAALSNSSLTEVALTAGYSAGLSVAASSVTVSTNALISVVVLRLSRWAGPTSNTGFQRNIFQMLALFYLINTSITPFVVAVIESYRTRHVSEDSLQYSTSSTGKNNVVYQVWYDSGGVINNQLFALLSSGASFAFSQLVPVGAVLKRYVLARNANSQQKLNNFYMPPMMHVGKNYAKIVKAVSLAIIYAPLYPPMYLAAAFYLLVSYYASRAGIAFWFARPSLMSERVAERLRGWLALTVGISLVFKRFAHSDSTADVPFYMSVVAWLAYMLLFEVIAKTLQQDADMNHMDAEGLLFEDVRKKHNLDVYVCPKLHRGDSAKKTSRAGVAFPVAVVESV